MDQVSQVRDASRDTPHSSPSPVSHQGEVVEPLGGGGRSCGLADRSERMQCESLMKLQKHLSPVCVVLLGGALVFASPLVAHAQSGSDKSGKALLEKLKHDQAQVAADVDALPFTKGQLFLYSLDPKGGIGYAVNTDTIFHGCTIIGKAEITDDKDKTTLVKDFAKGIGENTNTFGACFNPRHGLRLVVGSNTYDFVICFHCLSVMTYGFNQNQGFLVSSSPSDAFNGFLDKYHLSKTELPEGTSL